MCLKRRLYFKDKSHRNKHSYKRLIVFTVVKSYHSILHHNCVSFHT